MLSLKSAGSIMSETSRPSTPIDTARDTLASAHGLATRVQGLVDRLVGTVPEDTGGPAPDAPDGVLPTLQYLANDAARTIQQAHDALNRLERMLP